VRPRRLLARRDRSPHGKPLLAVDVDGVIVPHGEAITGPARLAPVGGRMVPIAAEAGECLRELARRFELLWATGWEGRANLLAPLLGLPELPHLRFGGAARFGSADWKLAPLTERAAGRPLAWIDDSFDDACRAWARERAEPTLLVDTESGVGLRRAHAERLLRWAAELEPSRRGA